jgi:hypothetical protein
VLILAACFLGSGRFWGVRKNSAVRGGGLLVFCFGVVIILTAMSK